MTSSSMVHFDLRNCLECGKELRGRLGKKYCDQACKSAYHNQHKNEKEANIQQINRIIRANRSILKMLCPQGKATVRKDVLEQMGFDFNHFTGLFKSDRNLYYFSYDYGFSPIFEKNVEKAMIIRKQGYMKQLGFEIWRKS